MKVILALVICLLTPVSAQQSAASLLDPVPLKSAITRVQPMTGIVLWDDSEHNATDTVQLEFSYMKSSDIVARRGEYDWSVLDKKLDAIARRKHQAIIRFYDTYPGRHTTVPAYIKALPDYRETHGTSEKLPTDFADWSHPELKRFTQEFYTRLAARYDRDPRLAFLQVGFGLWSEYHIYDGPFQLGRTFPDKAYQGEFLNHLATTFKSLPWSVSVDAAAAEVTPVAGNPDLLKLPFGLFDDSFLCQQHTKENEPNWNALDRKRYLRQPAGGEFSYYTDHDQKQALAPNGPHGVSFEKAAAAFHISYMIGNDQPGYQPGSRIRQAGLACGYQFRITAFRSATGKSIVTVANNGVAPLYRDAFVTVNGVRAVQSLKALAPGKSITVEISAGGKTPVLTIACDHLVPGQSIGYAADLK